MKKILLITAIMFHVIASMAQRFQWVSSSRQYNSNANIPVATDAVGNVYTLIDVDPTLPCIIQNDTIQAVVPGTWGTVVAKFGPTGNIIWGKMVSPDGGGIYGGRITVDDTGSVYASFNFPNGGHINLNDTIFASSAGSGKIVKFSSTGSTLRTINFPFSTDFPVITSLGTDLFLATQTHVDKLDSAFNTLWTINDPTNTLSFQHTGNSRADIFAQTNGQLVVSAWEFGNTTGVIPFGNDSVHFHSGGLDEGAIIKLDTTGHILWSRAFACDDFHPGIRSVCLDAHGNAYLGLEGYTYNVQTIFGNDTLINTMGTGDYCAILKWDSTGNPVRAIPLYPLASPPDLMDLTVNAQDELLVSGMIGSSQMYIDANDSIMGYGNFYLIKYNSAGVYQWFKTEAHNISTFVDGIAVRNGNEYVLGGSTGSGSNYQFDCIPDPTTGPTNWVTVVSELPVLYPVASFTFTHTDSVYTFTDQSQNVISWHWDFGDGDTSNLASPVHSFVSGGNYTVILNVTNGGCSSTDTLLIIGAGIAETNPAIIFNISPNPATEEIHLMIDNRQSAGENYEVSIYDMVGEKIINWSLHGENKTVLDVSTLPSGVYFVSIRDAKNSQVTRKIIKI
jgi:PKD repeat protein